MNIGKVRRKKNSIILVFIAITIEAVAGKCSLKGVLKYFANFTGKCLCRSLFFDTGIASRLQL